ncbi:MAG: helix-turn-helix transcriptional regulator [Coriobacteriales bacterium]|nr:helix-turn-helix transcriptional regulator [Coriobacteriales bacterium]
MDRVIGAQLKHLRKSQSVTQREVACRLQVTQSYVSLLEAGKRRLHLAELFGYSSAIQLSPECVYLNVREALESNRDTKHLVHHAHTARRKDAT